MSGEWESGEGRSGGSGEGRSGLLILLLFLLPHDYFSSSHTLSCCVGNDKRWNNE